MGVAGVGPSNQAAPTRTTAAATPNRTEGVSSLQRVQALIMSLPQVAKVGERSGAGRGNGKSEFDQGRSGLGVE